MAAQAANFHLPYSVKCMKNMTKTLIATLVFASTSMFAQASNLSQAPTNITADLSDYSSSDFGHTFTLGAGQHAGSANNFFADMYTFTVNGLTDVTALSTSLKSSVNSGLTITGFDLRNASSMVLHGTQDLSNFDANQQAWSFSSGLTPLAAGTYTLEIDGYVASANGGSYSGNIAIAAVPEPETYGMLLAGLGLLGFIARRRKTAA
ncbi:hypothetical protein AAKU55_000933 [Oxalobacteraceae bacterium GrIS 1.11]